MAANTPTTEDLIRLMHTMRETGISRIKSRGVLLERGHQEEILVAPTHLDRSEPPEPGTDQAKPEVPVSLELEVRDRQMDEMRLTDPYEYEQALLREDLQEK